MWGWLSGLVRDSSSSSEAASSISRLGGGAVSGRLIAVTGSRPSSAAAAVGVEPRSYDVRMAVDDDRPVVERLGAVHPGPTAEVTRRGAVVGRRHRTSVVV